MAPRPGLEAVEVQQRDGSGPQRGHPRRRGAGRPGRRLGTGCSRSERYAIGWDPMDTRSPAEVLAPRHLGPTGSASCCSDRKLMAVPGSGNGKIPAALVQDGVILKHLPGPVDRAPGRRPQRRGEPRLVGSGRRLAARPPAGGTGRRPAHRGTRRLRAMALASTWGTYVSGAAGRVPVRHLRHWSGMPVRVYAGGDARCRRPS